MHIEEINGDRRQFQSVSLSLPRSMTTACFRIVDCAAAPWGDPEGEARSGAICGASCCAEETVAPTIVTADEKAGVESCVGVRAGEAVADCCGAVAKRLFFLGSGFGFQVPSSSTSMALVSF